MNYQSKSVIILLIILILISLSYDILNSPINRYILTKKISHDASIIAKQKNKKLMIIGDPCTGNYFNFMSKYFPNSHHGDITIDLYGCEICSRNNINDFTYWKKFNDNEYVIIESAVFSYSNNIPLLLSEIIRISGGDFLSAGGTTGYLWQKGLYKTYDDKILNIIYPYDFRKDKYFKYKIINNKQ